MIIKRFASCLERKGITAYKMAKDLEINQGTVGKWATGKVVPDLKSIEIIADYFDVSVDYLLGRDKLSTSVINTGTVSGVQAYEYNNSTTHNNVPQQPSQSKDEGKRSEEETELFRIYSKLDVKKRHKLMALAFELEEEIKK